MTLDEQTKQEIYSKIVLTIQMARIGKSESMQDLADATYNDIATLIEERERLARIDECEQLMALKWSVDERLEELKEEQ